MKNWVALQEIFEESYRLYRSVHVAIFHKVKTNPLEHKVVFLERMHRSLGSRLDPALAIQVPSLQHRPLCLETWLEES